MTKINLHKLPTIAPAKFNKEETKHKTDSYIGKLDELQNRLYAGRKTSLLIVLQGPDASGKDGAIKTVFSSVNPQGIQVKSFKRPTEEELAYDFLWRVHQHTPARGMIQIFNRSHYEDVLSPQVEKMISPSEVKRRYDHINNFEMLLMDNQTRILKFYLHVSQEEQRERLNERLRLPSKKWKHNPDDEKAASRFSNYQRAYENIFRHCSAIPWRVIPSDQNWYKEYLIAKAIYEELDRLKLKYPKENK